MNWRRALGLRSRAKVEEEVDEEIASHLERAERDLIASGKSAGEAEQIAAERFGDVAAARRACVAVALEERIMLQKINLVLIIVVGVTLGYGTYMTHRAQAHNMRALDEIAARLESAGSVAPVTAAGRSDGGGNVYLSGRVARPGAFAHPGDGLTVRRLLAAAGGVEAGAERVTVRSVAGDLRGTLEKTDLAQAQGPDLEVRPGDLVVVD